MESLYNYSLIEIFPNSIKRSNSDVIHDVSLKILDSCHRKINNNLVPIETYGDGNCMFRAISKACYGTDKACWELRYRTLFELILHKEYFLSLPQTSSKIKDKMMSWYDLLSPYGEDNEGNFSNDGLDSSQIYDQQVKSS
jgi:hypothetical protein